MSLPRTLWWSSVGSSVLMLVSCLRCMAESPTPSPAPSPLPSETRRASGRNLLRQAIQADLHAQPTPTPTRAPTPPVVAKETPINGVQPQERRRLPGGWEVPPTKPQPAPEPTPISQEPAPTPAPGVVVLEKLVVEEKADTALRARIVNLQEERVDLEKKIEKIEDSTLDRILNSPAIAIFGGDSTGNRIARLEGRIAFIDRELHLLRALEQSTTLEEREAIRRSLDELYNPTRSKP